MTNESLQFVITAQDHASGAIDRVEGKLLGLTKSSRLLKRETHGLSTFANALDTVAGTRFGGLISDLTTVAEVAGPLKELGGALKDDLENGFSKALAAIPGSEKVISAAKAAGSKMGSLIGNTLSSPAGALAIGAGGALIIDEWAKQMAQKLDDARGQLTTALAADPAQARKIQQQIAPWRGLLDITGQVLQNFPLLGEATSQIGGDMRGFATDVDAAAKNTDGLVAALKKASDMDGVWYKSAQIMTGDLSTALQGTRGVVTAAVEKAQLAAQHPNALADQEAIVQQGIDKINALASQPGTTFGQRTIYDQQRSALQSQLENISGQPAGEVYGPPTPAVYGPPAPHTHDIYINGNKVMDALDPVIGKRLATASSAPYTRN